RTHVSLLVSRAAFADRCRQIQKVRDLGRMHQEEGGGTEIRRRFLVEKNGRVASQAIVSVLLGEKALDGHEIAENSHALLASLSALREFRGSHHTRADERENFKLDGSLERRRARKSIQCVEDQKRV